ncbi:carbohydrate ABC transporter permease [Paenibacillus piri]|nr:sugar ABC transporter permease [Paenibacillus piri]
MRKTAYGEPGQSSAVKLAGTGERLRYWAKEIYKNRVNYFFIAPMYLFLIAFLIIPTIQGLYLSFYQFTADSAKRFVGLQNFIALFRDPVFWIALKNTAVLVIGVVPSSLLVSLIISVIIHRRSQILKSFVRGAFYLPLVVSSVALSISWKYIYDPAIGLGNYVLGLFGLDPVVWLGDARYVLPALMFIIFTFSLGKPIMLYLASLGAIPDTYYEAARIDGAGSISQFVHITLPMLKPTTLYLVVTGTIGAFQVFVFVKLLTSGGPNNSSQTLAYMLYEKAFIFGQFGIGCVIGTILCLICMGIAIVEYKFLSSDIEY